MMTTPLAYVPKTPDVLLAVDSSGTMQETFGSGTRASVLRVALREAVFRHQGRIRFGYEEFPLNTAVSACPAGAFCCAASVSVPPAFMNAAAVDAALAGCTGTCERKASPAPDALRRCHEFYDKFSDGVKRRYVVLILDGAPNCASGSSVSDACPETVSAADALTAAGIRTAVLGVGEDAASGSCLDAVARAGGLPSGVPGYAHFPGGQPDLLGESLETLLSKIALPTCDIELVEAPPDPSRVQVYFDGEEVPWDPTHQTGWDYDPPGSTARIGVFGSYCNALEAFAVQHLDVRFGCGPCGGAVPCK